MGTFVATVGGKSTTVWIYSDWGRDIRNEGNELRYSLKSIILQLLPYIVLAIVQQFFSYARTSL